MSTIKQSEAWYNPDEFLRNVTIDNVIFGYHDRELKVLLQKPTGIKKWTLTGGYIKKTEDIEEAAERVATTRTGLKNLFLQQFRSFGSPKRLIDDEITPEHLSEVTGEKIPADFLIFDYAVSIGFYTLTEYSLVNIESGLLEEEISWWPIDKLPKLLFDHRVIIAEALKALQVHTSLYPVGYELLPEKFTLPELHDLYETILQKPIHSSNFARRLLSTGIVKKLDEKRSIGAHRSPYLYKFDKKKYDTALKNGTFLAF